jgi:hypothetical protein
MYFVAICLVVLAKADLIPVKKKLSASENFDLHLFEELLTTKVDGKDRLGALFHSDIEKLLKSLEHDFPEILSISSIGKSYLGRPINMLTLDARNYLVQQQFNEHTAKKEIVKNYH